MDSKRPVAVFDIDGTVFRSSLLIELVDRLILRGVFPEEARKEYEHAQEEWLDRKADYEPYIKKVVQSFGKYLISIPYGDVADVAGEVIEEMRHRTYRYTRDLITDLKKRGYYLLAISHSPKFIVDGFAYEMGFHKSYGTFYATGATNRFTGEIEDERNATASAAAQLGKLGGAARAKSLTAEQRAEIARKGAATRWKSK